MRVNCRSRGPAETACIYAFWVYVAYGGLISYGPDVIDPYRRAAGYIEPTRYSRLWATHVAAPAQVSYWHKADMPTCLRFVRFEGVKRTSLSKWVKCAPIADKSRVEIPQCSRLVCAIVGGAQEGSAGPH